MNIQLGEDYRIESDSLNYILKKRKVSDPNHRFSKGVAKTTWVDVGYYAKLEHLVPRLLELEIKESEAISLLELTEALHRIAEIQIKRIKKEEE